MKNFTFDFVQVHHYSNIEMQANSLEEAIDKAYESILAGEIQPTDSNLELEDWEVEEKEEYVPMMQVVTAQTAQETSGYTTMQQVQEQNDMKNYIDSTAQFEQIDLLTQMAKLINTIEECSRKVAELEQLELVKQTLPNGYVPMARTR